MIQNRYLNLLATLLLCATVTLHAAASAADVPAPYKPSAHLTDKGDPAQLAAIKRLLQALEIPTIVRTGMANIPQNERERHELGAHMARHSSDDDFCSVLAPSYVKYISADQADRLAIHYRTSIGRRRVIAMVARETGLKGEKNPFFTPTEIREIKAIDALPGAVTLVKERDKIMAANIAAVAAWSTEYQQYYLQQALSNLGQIITAQRNYKTGDPGEKFTIRRTGLATLDNYVMIVAESNIATVNANRMLQNDLNSYQLDKLLKKDRLVSSAGIAQSRLSLASGGERIEAYLREMDQQQTTYRQRISAAAPDKQSLAAFEPGMMRMFEDLVRFGETQRALLDVLGRVLDFAESRLGHIRAGDQGLLFENEDDLQMYNKLMEKTKELADIEEKMNADRIRRMDAALKSQVK
jgi:hypothetical protein